MKTDDISARSAADNNVLARQKQHIAMLFGEALEGMNSARSRTDLAEQALWRSVGSALIELEIYVTTKLLESRAVRPGNHE